VQKGQFIVAPAEAGEVSLFWHVHEKLLSVKVSKGKIGIAQNAESKNKELFPEPIPAYKYFSENITIVERILRWQLGLIGANIGELINSPVENVIRALFRACSWDEASKPEAPKIRSRLVIYTKRDSNEIKCAMEQLPKCNKGDMSIYIAHISSTFELLKLQDEAIDKSTAGELSLNLERLSLCEKTEIYYPADT